MRTIKLKNVREGNYAVLVFTLEDVNKLIELGFDDRDEGLDSTIYALKEHLPGVFYPDEGSWSELFDLQEDSGIVREDRDIILVGNIQEGFRLNRTQLRVLECFVEQGIEELNLAPRPAPYHRSLVHDLMCTGNKNNFKSGVKYSVKEILDNYVLEDD